MRERDRRRGRGRTVASNRFGAVAFVFMSAGSAWAQEGGSPAPAAAAASSAPRTTTGDAGGAPAPQEGEPRAAAPKGRATIPGMFEPPEDTEQEDPSLAPGTIAVSLRDAEDRPVSDEMVTLGILINSIAKGDSRKHLQATTDAGGMAKFSGVEMASNVAYRVSVGYQGGLICRATVPAATGQGDARRAARLSGDAGTSSRLLIVAESTVAAEIRDDRIQIEEAVTIYNLGKTAWQPDDVRLNLPESATAFNAQASMSDQGVDEVGGAAKLHGTFPPGRHSIVFRWQLPWSGETDVDFGVGLPPHVAVARVMMAGTQDIKLDGHRLSSSGCPAQRARATIPRDRTAPATGGRQTGHDCHRHPRVARGWSRSSGRNGAGELRGTYRAVSSVCRATPRGRAARAGDGPNGECTTAR